MPPCPHFDLKIVQRSKRQSAVAAAAYQSGERLFSEYDQKQKYYSHKSEIVHTEIMLPPHAPPEYADRNTLWNAAEAIEKQWNSQLARRLVLAIPRDIPPAQQADLIRDFCREFFVSKGMIADFMRLRDMKKLFIALAAVALTACVKAPEKTVKVYAWQGYRKSVV